MAVSPNNLKAENPPASNGPVAGPSVRVPPQSLEAEACTLGSMILDLQCVGEILQFLHATDFYRHDHQVIYEAILSLYDEKKSIDLVLLRDILKQRGQLEQVGGVDYLVNLVESVPSSANAMHYAHIVHDKAMLRNLITASTEIADQAYQASQEASEILEHAEQRIFEVTEQKIVGQAVPMKEIMAKVFSSLDQRSGKMITGLATGFYELDEQTCGLQRGEMVIIAARPSMGKTALGLNIAEYVGADNPDNPQAVAVFSLEMGSQQLAERMLAGRSHINSHNLRKGMLGPRDYEVLGTTADELSRAMIFVDDTPQMTPLELRAKARRLKMMHDIQLVVVDYLQLMHAPGSESRQQEVGLISRHIKALARELDIPVVVMAQLNRGPEGREDHRPRMSDLRESGNIEQDADVIMLLHRESYYKSAMFEDASSSVPSYSPEPSSEDNVAELIIAKQRNGPTGTIKLLWHPEWTRFENLTQTPM